MKKEQPTNPNHTDGEGVWVARAPTRCPWCHEHVSGRTRWVACAGCLARHHADCWMNEGGCSTCRGRRPLLPASGLAGVRRHLRRPQNPSRRGTELLIGGVALALGGLAAIGTEHLIDRATPPPQARAVAAAAFGETRVVGSQVELLLEENMTLRSRLRTANARAKRLSEKNARLNELADRAHVVRDQLARSWQSTSR